MFFTVAWPDGTRQRCYSPSLVVEEYLVPGESYRVDEFVERSCTALQVGSERVRQKYGFGCGNALAQIESIQARAAAVDASAEARVTVEQFER